MSTKTGLQFDEDATRRTEAIYSTPDVVGQRREVLRVLTLRPGERVLDIGSGPGFLALDMAQAVGPSGMVCGIDISENMVSMSERRCAGQTCATFQKGDATRLPFPDGEFDVAVSTQVYEYVADMTEALAELHRVLRRGARVLILDTDWDSLLWHASDQARMTRVLTAWKEHLVDPHLPRTLSSRLKRAGFLVRRREVIPLLNPEYDPNTYSHGLIGLIGAFVVGRQGVTPDEVQGWAEDLRALGGDGAYFFSLNRYLFLAEKPDVNA